MYKNMQHSICVRARTSHNMTQLYALDIREGIIAKLYTVVVLMFLDLINNYSEAEST